MAPSIPNADISNNATKISTSSTLPPTTSPNYESTHKNRRRVSSVEGIKHIWLITGPAGCGKTTVAGAVSEKLGLRYLEGDDFHSKANVDKMASGNPLTDEDRWDWLLTLRQASINALSKPSPDSHQKTPRGVVVTCSALKKSYRNVLRGHPAPSPSGHLPDAVGHDMDENLNGKWDENVSAKEEGSHIKTHFLYLSAQEEVLIQRVGGREGHYMGANMVKSQLESLEVPNGDEEDCLQLDVSVAAEEVERRAVETIRERMDLAEQS